MKTPLGLEYIRRKIAKKKVYRCKLNENVFLFFYNEPSDFNHVVG